MLLPPGETSPSIQLPFIVDDDGVIDEAGLHEMPDGNMRTRQICFIGIYRSNQLLEKFLVAEPTDTFTQPDIYRVEEIDMVVAISVLSGTRQPATLDEQ